MAYDIEVPIGATFRVTFQRMAGGTPLPVDDAQWRLSIQDTNNSQIFRYNLAVNDDMVIFEIPVVTTGALKSWRHYSYYIDAIYSNGDVIRKLGGVVDAVLNGGSDE